MTTHATPLDQVGRAQHAMWKIAKQIDPEADMDLPDRPPGHALDQVQSPRRAV